jgi:hypothetical protein
MAGTSVGSHSHKRPHSLAKIEFIPRSLEQISCYFRPACAMLLLCQDKPRLVDVKPKEHSQGRNPSRTCAWHGPDAQITCVSLAFFFLNGQSCFANAACEHIRSFPLKKERRQASRRLPSAEIFWSPVAPCHIYLSFSFDSVTRREARLSLWAVGRKWVGHLWLWHASFFDKE